MITFFLKNFISSLFSAEDKIQSSGLLWPINTYSGFLKRILIIFAASYAEKALQTLKYSSPVLSLSGLTAMHIPAHLETVEISLSSCNSEIIISNPYSGCILTVCSSEPRKPAVYPLLIKSGPFQENGRFNPF